MRAGSVTNRVTCGSSSDWSIATGISTSSVSTIIKKFFQDWQPTKPSAKTMDWSGAWSGEAAVISADEDGAICGMPQLYGRPDHLHESRAYRAKQPMVPRGDGGIR
jgi:hypothetical protein